MNLDPNAFVADPDLVQALEAHAKPLSCSEGRVLFRQGEPSNGIYILDRGDVTLTMVSLTGSELMSVEAYPCSVLGIPGTIGNSPYTLTAVAKPGAVVRFLSREEFSTLMTSNPALSLKILQVLAAEVRTARQALLDH